MRFFLAFLIAGLLAAPVAEARVHTPYRGHRIAPSGGAIDTVGAPAAAAYSFRKLRAAYAGKAVQLRRTDLAVQDIGFTANGDFDTAAATTFCNATSCFVAKWYDQSGNARDAVQATAANQPALVFNCNGTLPCSQITAAVQNVATVASITPATGVLSMSLVMERLAGTTECGLRQNGNANQIRAGTATANLWWLNLGGVQAAASEAAWHVGLGVWNGASTSLSIDGGTAVTGSITNVTSGATQFFGTDTTTCRFAEGIIWDNYALTAAERTALTANQRAYWGF